MSKAALLKFYDRIQSNPELEGEVTAALRRHPSAVVEIGAREGFLFTDSELAAALAELPRGDGNELNDDDLDLVTGGGSAPVNSKDVTGSTKS